MERLFEKLRCRTITAVNGSEAMRYALSEVQFDIIMMEFKLPQLNGADVARMIRDTKSVNTHTPIICCTGYLKDLPETHHFDALIEKPPTLSRLTETLCKFCQWKPPPKDHPLNPSANNPILAPISSRLTSSMIPQEGSPSSASSGFVPITASSYRSSSREDSIGSSYFGDIDSIKPEELPVFISRQATDDWGNAQGASGAGAGAGGGGLGISDEPNIPRSEPITMSSPPPIPRVLHATSAPSILPAMTTPVVHTTTPRNQPSVEDIRAKRESHERRKRYEGAESGDDEDEELGNSNSQSRAKSPQGARAKGKRSGSKLGTEMMRTNSRGSVVSDAGEILGGDCVAVEGPSPSTVSSPGGAATGGEVTPLSCVGVPGPSLGMVEEGLAGLRIADDGLETLPEDREQEESCAQTAPSVVTSASRVVRSPPQIQPPLAGYRKARPEKASDAVQDKPLETAFQSQTLHATVATAPVPGTPTTGPHPAQSITTTAPVTITTTPPNTAPQQQHHQPQEQRSGPVLTAEPVDLPGEDATPRPATSITTSGFNPGKSRSTLTPDTYGAELGIGPVEHHITEGESEATPRASERDKRREKSRERRLRGLDWIRRP
ncbi:hypothetical protein ACJ72_05825 [Emergomyces africanus]|uniref:Stress response regulator protein 1 n=1 Tax=Emergomyces africanus TaxID=1955775 RepID=A0A1B7NT06_9EURO|nr:hypothetical protein ACJ72_05825 [Emergomyces africanus]